MKEDHPTQNEGEIFRQDPSQGSGLVSVAITLHQGNFSLQLKETITEKPYPIKTQSCRVQAQWIKLPPLRLKHYCQRMSGKIVTSQKIREFVTL